MHTIKFELSEKAALFGEAADLKDSLHEALCQAIHEQDPEAIKWLSDNVVDIQG